jgi:hypothetical protein
MPQFGVGEGMPAPAGGPQIRSRSTAGGDPQPGRCGQAVRRQAPRELVGDQRAHAVPEEGERPVQPRQKLIAEEVHQRVTGVVRWEVVQSAAARGVEQAHLPVGREVLLPAAEGRCDPPA